MNGVGTKRCASKDAAPEGGWIAGSHIDRRRKRVSAKTLPRMGWTVRSHIGWGGERNIISNVWDPFHSKHILKTLRGGWKRKVQRGQYMLAMSFSRYSFPPFITRQLFLHPKF